MQDVTKYYTWVAVGVVMVTLGGVYWFFNYGSDQSATLPAWVSEFQFAPQTTETESALAPGASGVERWYSSKDPQFSFRLPDGYTAPNIDTEVPGVRGVYVSNNAGSELTLYAYPIASGLRVDEKTIRAYLAPQVVSDIRETVLSTVVRGYQFISTDSDGIETLHVWAAYNGYVYTIQSLVADAPLFAFVTQNLFFAPAVPTAPEKK